MATAEFIIGRSSDDAADRKQEARKVLWALLAALFIHLLIGYALAVSNGLFRSEPLAEEEKPMEMTFVDLSPAKPVPKNSMFIENDESKQTAEPKDKTFESNANSVAASEAGATGNLPMPSQDGREQPMLNFQSQQHSIKLDGAQPQPSAAPVETPQPSQAPTAAPTPMPDQLALLTKTPTPPPVQKSTPSRPQRPSSAYRPEQRRTKISGNISNHGISSVNAIATPLGRYEKILKDSIGSRWYYYMEQRRDLASIGTAQVRFFVDRSGRVKNLKMVENTSNEAFANICLQSILEAQLPPIPDDVADALPPEGLEVEGMNFIIFPN